MKSKEWIFRYEPSTIKDMIATEEKKATLKKVYNELPNTLLQGKPGTGKGTFMNILTKKEDVECLKINASEKTGIDFIRDNVFKFSKAFSPGVTKIVYFNEAERISPQGQDSLKDLIEAVRNITRFFFLTNNENKITDAIKSRCGYHIDLNDPPAKDIYNRCLHILSNEGVELENKKALVEMIKKLYPDIRKTIGTLQSNVFDGKVKNISFSTTEDMFKSIFTLMIEKDIENLRKKLKSNYIDYDDLYKFLYREIIEDPDKVKKPGDFIIQTAEYMFRNTTVASGEVNFMGYFFSLMYTEAI